MSTLWARALPTLARAWVTDLLIAFATDGFSRLNCCIVNVHPEAQNLPALLARMPFIVNVAGTDAS